jgi:hypothetical protein
VCCLRIVYEERKTLHNSPIPASLRSEGEEDEEGGAQGNAQLVKLPEGLRALSGELRELVVRSTRLAVVPGWVGELTAMEVSGVCSSENCRRASGSSGRSAAHARMAERAGGTAGCRGQTDLAGQLDD